jgi:hypothetical protein
VQNAQGGHLQSFQGAAGVGHHGRLGRSWAAGKPKVQGVALAIAPHGNALGLQSLGEQRRDRRRITILSPFEE